MISFKEACVFVEKYHRHHLPPKFHKFSIAVNDGEKVVGVIMVNRPVNITLDDGWTLEVSRCCTDGTKNAASMLYAAAWRAARAMGAKRLITYTLREESGISIKAAGWREVGRAGGGTWNRKSRPRVDCHPIGQKTLWEIGESKKGERPRASVI